MLTKIIKKKPQKFSLENKKKRNQRIQNNFLTNEEKRQQRHGSIERF